MKSMMLAKCQEVLALGWMADGTPIWPIVGEDPDPTADPSGTTGDPAGGSGEGGASGAPAEVPPDPAGTGDATQLLEQIATLTRRLNAADAAKGTAEKRLREIDDAGKSELEKANTQVQELTAKLAAATEAATRARLEREILKHPGYIWHDPDVVLTLVDLDAINIDEETGKVTGVGDALKKLAASKPYLLKGKNPDGGGQGGNGQGGGGKPAGASGTNPTGGTPTSPEKRREELAKKYRL